MKKTIIALLLLVSSSAYADGFTCETNQRDLNIKIYNHTNPDMGTRRGAVMVLSDPQVKYGLKEIAKFSDINSTLSSDSSEYTANVDLRFNDSGRKGEYLLGTRLGFVKEIVVDLDFSYDGSVRRGDYVPGAIYLLKRNGEEIERKITCVRYIKGEQE